MKKPIQLMVCIVGAIGCLLLGLGQSAESQEKHKKWSEEDLLRTGRALSGGGTLITPLSDIKQQTIVIDIPGIETQGESRPTQWGPVLIGSNNFIRHNLRHSGALGTSLQRPEPGITTTLPHAWNEQRAGNLLTPVLTNIKAGKNAYVKIDQNIKAASYLTTGKAEEGRWVRSVGNWLVVQIRQINPNAKVILNTHSKGTLDAHGMDLSRFNQVILSSDRGSLPEVQQVVNNNPRTRFTLITGDRDFAHGLGGFMKLSGSNVTVINLKGGGLLPTTVHSQVTDPTFRGTFEVRTHKGAEVKHGSLGAIVAENMLPSTIRQYWVDQNCAGLLTVSNTMASMAGKANPQRVLLVGNNEQVIQTMRQGLPPGTQIKVIPYSDPTKIQKEASAFRANVILGVRSLSSEQLGRDFSTTVPLHLKPPGSPPPLLINIPSMPKATSQYPPQYTPMATPLPSPMPPQKFYTPPTYTPPTYTPPRTYTPPPPTYTPPPQIYTPPPPTYTPPPQIYTPPPTFRR